MLPMSPSWSAKLADTQKTEAQRAYESAPGALYKLIPWTDLPAYWQAYWASRAAGTL
jgi:hypothetical protein